MYIVSSGTPVTNYGHWLNIFTAWLHFLNQKLHDNEHINAGKLVSLKWTMIFDKKKMLLGKKEVVQTIIYYSQFAKFHVYGLVLLRFVCRKIVKIPNFNVLNLHEVLFFWNSNVTCSELETEILPGYSGEQAVLEHQLKAMRHVYKIFDML